MRVLAAISAAVLLLGACTDTSEKHAVPTAPAGPHWVGLPDAPAARQEVAAVAIDDEVWIAGGLTEKGATARVDSFNTKTNTWRPVPPLPQALHHAMAAEFSGSLIVAGGFDAQSKPSDRVYRLLPGSAWTELPRLKRPRAAGVLVQVGANGNDLYAIGGAAAGKLVPAIEHLDLKNGEPKAWREIAQMPVPRHHIAAAVAPPYVYVSGGRVPSASGGDHNVTAFDRYDTSKNKWESLGAIPSGRSGHGSAYVQLNGAPVIALFGGEDPRSGGPSISATDVYDVTTRKWSRSLPAMFRARHGVGVVTIDGKVYVFLGGGRAGLAPTAVSDVLVLS